MSTPFYAGIDIGSITTKSVILTGGKIIGAKLDFTGYNSESTSKKIYEELLTELHLEPAAIRKIVSTGYGRGRISFADKAVTEITCHAAGARFLNPKIRSIIDVGGQDSKAMVLNPDGKVKEFVMNDKCAAGTGRFLEVMARALEVDLNEFGACSLKANHPSKISSICTVFAESEIISLLSKGENRENIIAGIHDAIAVRISSLARRIGVVAPIMMTGGVAKNIGVVKALENKLSLHLDVSESAQITGAIGAAVIAMQLDVNSE